MRKFFRAPAVALASCVLASVGGAAYAITITVASGEVYTVNSPTTLDGAPSSVAFGGTLINDDDLTNDGTLNNDDVLGTSGALTNNGDLDNWHALTNNGALTNNVFGTLTNDRLLQNIGDLNNNGAVDITAGSVVSGDGTVTQSAGRLTVNGDMTQASVTINGGTLAGNGTITSQVTINTATVSAGAAQLTAGTLHITGDLDVLAASTLHFELGGPSALDMIDMFGIATIADGTIFDVDFLGGYVATHGSFFDLLVADGIVGDLSMFVFDFTGAAGVSWAKSLFTQADNRRSVRLTASAIAPSQVPLPAALPLFLVALGGLGFAARRRKAA